MAAAQLTAADSAVGPRLTRQALGKGEALCLPQPLFRASANIDPQLPPENVLQQVLPCAERRVSLDGPETVEVTLRQKGSDWILRLVNIAPGQRERDPKALGFLNLHVKKLPPAPACRVSIRLADRPRSVALQPQNKVLTEWLLDGRA